MDSNFHSESGPRNGASATAPLKGAIICCTSVPEEKRTQLAEYATQMGGVHQNDLTVDVTHLIVGDHNTPKYKYVAKARTDVKPMTCEWIEAVRELWMNDRETDMETLEKEYTLPTFSGLKFSMTGCDNPDERAEIAAMVRSNGATYEGDLTKRITHLICFRTEGAKYKVSKTWDIQVVSIEWLRDSMERGMMLDETLYDPLLPVEERGIGAWDKTRPKRTSLGKRVREDSVSGADRGKKTLRRTASSKLNSQSQQMWGDILGAGGGGGGNVIEVARSGVWDTDTTQQAAEPTPKPKNSNTTNATRPMGTEEMKPRADGIFSKCRFYFHGFTPVKVDVLYRHLLPQGSEVAGSLDELSSTSNPDGPTNLFIIIPHDLPILKHPSPPESNLPIRKVTEWWVERCLHFKRLVDPQEHVVGRPFPVFPIQGFRVMTICSSAFSGIDLLHFKNSVELLGAKYSEDMTPACSVLVTKCQSGLRKDKFQHADEWNIPIVIADWLWDCITQGIRIEPKQYRCRSRSQKRSGSLPNTEAPLPTKPQQAHREQNAKHVSRTKSFPLTVAPKSPSSAAPKPHCPKANAKPNTEVNTEANTSGFFTVDEDTNVKEELEFYAPPQESDASDTTNQDLYYKPEPLPERERNSPSRTVSTAPAPSGHPHSKPLQEDISNDISDLLAKTKRSVQPAFIESIEGPRKRGPKRILGRAASNISAASIGNSRSESVDSTVTPINAIENPPAKNEDLAKFLNDDLNVHNDENSQPPATQLRYEDTQSAEVEAHVMAKMRGEKLPPKRSGFKEKAPTITSLQELKTRPRTTRQRAR